MKTGEASDSHRTVMKM